MVRCWPTPIVLRANWKHRGIGKDDKVLIWGENCAEWIVAFFGCLLRGAVVVPIDKIAAPDFAGRVAQQVDARLCVGSPHNQIPGIEFLHLDTLREALAALSTIRQSPRRRSTRDDIVQIVFTSGTTAEPRGVVISHGNILANLEPLEREIGNYRKYERIFHPLRFLNLLPLSHVFGQFLGIFLPQLLAATVIFQDTLNPSEVLAGHQEGARVGRRRCAASDGVAERQDRARSGSRGQTAIVSAAVRGRQRRAFRETLVAIPENSQPLRLEILGLHLRRRGARCRHGRVLAHGSALS